MENTVANKRPAIITIICIFGFLGAIIVIPLIFTEAVQSIGAWYPPLLIISSVVGFISMIGFWKMKKWAVYLYTGMMVINQIVLFATGLWSVGSLLIPLTLVIIGFYHLKKMS